MQRYPYRNNGLPSDLHFKEIEEGDVLLAVINKKSEPEHVIVREALEQKKPPSYRGKVEFVVVAASDKGKSFKRVVDGRAVLSKVGNVFNCLEKLNNGEEVESSSIN